MADTIQLTSNAKGSLQRDNFREIPFSYCLSLFITAVHLPPNSA